eukprot:2111906-Amphidinium_carterae.1
MDWMWYINTLCLRVWELWGGGAITQGLKKAILFLVNRPKSRTVRYLCHNPDSVPTSSLRSCIFTLHKTCHN